jgi:hypothetical protein
MRISRLFKRLRRWSSQAIRKRDSPSAFRTSTNAGNSVLTAEGTISKGTGSISCEVEFCTFYTQSQNFTDKGRCILWSTVSPAPLTLPYFLHLPAECPDKAFLVTLSWMTRHHTSCTSLVNGEILCFVYLSRKWRNIVFTAHLSENTRYCVSCTCTIKEKIYLLYLCCPLTVLFNYCQLIVLQILGDKWVSNIGAVISTR